MQMGQLLNSARTGRFANHPVPRVRLCAGVQVESVKGRAETLEGRASLKSSFMILVILMIAVVAQAEETIIGIEKVSRLDLLPRFQQSVKMASISSYDRTGGNDDGFSGKYSFVRKEGDGLVIADLKGPGVIYRIWTPTPTDDPIEFYFDGETAPRIKERFRDIFDGEHPPFVAPLAGFGAGGFYAYYPLAYRQSCKVIIRAERVQ